MVKNKKRGAVTLSTAANGATPAKPKPNGQMHKVHPNVRRVMELHQLKSPDMVFSIEDKADSRRLTMQKKIELWSQTVLGPLLVGVMDEPSVLTEAFKTGRAAKPPSPLMSIPTLEMTVRMFRETVPEAT